MAGGSYIAYKSGFLMNTNHEGTDNPVVCFF